MSGGKFAIGIAALAAAAAGGAWLTASGGGASGYDAAKATAGLTAFSSTQQQEVGQLVHAYLLANPEIIPQAIQQLQKNEARKVLANIRDDLERGAPGAVAGNPDGDVTLVEFFDFRCPYCRQAHSELTTLIQEDPNLRVVFRDFPVLDRDGAEPLSMRAALAALAAGRQGRYNEVRNALFEAPGRLTQETLVQAVRKSGADERKIAADMESRDLKAELEKNYQYARILGFNGTPSYVIGDQIIPGAVGVDALREAIREARAERRG
jgi:protein-disulfide isomerase